MFKYKIDLKLKDGKTKEDLMGAFNNSYTAMGVGGLGNGIVSDIICCNEYNEDILNSVCSQWSVATGLWTSGIFPINVEDRVVQKNGSREIQSKIDDNVKKCLWKYHDEEFNIWETECGALTQLEIDGIPDDNGIKFCFNCGRRVSVPSDYKK